MEQKENKTFKIVIAFAFGLLLMSGFVYYLDTNHSNYFNSYKAGYLNGFSNGTNYTLFKISNCIAFNSETKEPFIFIDYQNQTYFYLNAECLRNELQ